MRGQGKFTSIIALLTASLLISNLGPQPALAATFGSEIKILLESSESSASWFIPESDLTGIGRVHPDDRFYVYDKGSSERTSVLCYSAGGGIECTTKIPSALNLFYSGAPFFEGVFRSGPNIIWTTKVEHVDRIVKSILISSPNSGEHIQGIDSPNIKLDLTSLNARQVQVPATFEISLNGLLLSTLNSPNGYSQASIPESTLSIGSNNFEITASNEHGTSSQTYAMSKLKPQVDSISIESEKVFYPAKDNFMDDLAIDVLVKSNTKRKLLGVGKLTITDSSNKILFRTDFKATGTIKTVFKPVNRNTFKFGKLRIQVQFTPKAGPSKTFSKTASASPKKLVYSIGSVSVPAWKAKVRCEGGSPRNCSRDNIGAPNGIQLYNDYSSAHQSFFSVSLPAGTYKWRVSLVGFLGLSDSPWLLYATDSQSYTSFMGRTPYSYFSGTWNSEWTKRIISGSAKWKMLSIFPSSIWFSSVKITYMKKTLK
jgi:hypothetical protein